jgi:hypothetical protein
MHITTYVAPSPDDLGELKTRLNLTGAQMAELAALGGSHQWRKYTGGQAPREMNIHMLFFIAAQLTLSGDELKAVVDKMREIGANVEV